MPDSLPGENARIGATIFGAPEGFDALLIARRAAEHPGMLLHVARDESRMTRLADLLAYFAPELEVLRFPAWDCLPYDRVSPNPTVVSERIVTLARLSEADAKRCIVLTTVNAAVQRVPPPWMFDGASLSLAPGSTIRPEKLIAFLEAHGYGRADTVMEPGEYATRGGIIDIFASGAADPVRLDLFGDTIESVRRFDPATQRSTEPATRFSLRPVSEVPLDAESVARFRTGWRDLFGQNAARDPIYEAISEGRRAPGMEHWTPLFHDSMATLIDYLDKPSVTFDLQTDDVLTARLEMVADHYDARKMVSRDGEVPYRPLPPERLYLDRAGWEAMFAGMPVFAFSPYGLGQPVGRGVADDGGARAGGAGRADRGGAGQRAVSGGGGEHGAGPGGGGAVPAAAGRGAGGGDRGGDRPGGAGDHAGCGGADADAAVAGVAGVALRAAAAGAAGGRGGGGTEALLAFGAAVPGAAGAVFQLSERGDLVEAAARLFAGLRALDAEGERLGLTGIAAMAVPEAGLGLAINDRLQRAAAPR